GRDDRAQGPRARARGALRGQALLRAAPERPAALGEGLRGAAPARRSLDPGARAPAYAIERTELAIGDERLITLCVEAPSLERCRLVGRELGLERFAPSSFPEMLAALS